MRSSSGMARRAVLRLEPLEPRRPLAIDAPFFNFDGQGFTGSRPPDTVGDVGVDHYIQIVNGGAGSQLTIYEKSTGALTFGPTAVTGLTAMDINAPAGTPCANGRGDPIVLYDQMADRWLVAEFANPAGGNFLCVYISQTSDPTDDRWFRYHFATPNFPDYPKYAVWPDAYYVGTNEPGPSAAYALDRANMLQGLPAAAPIRRTAPDLPGFGFQMLIPADLDGDQPPSRGTPAYFLRHRDDEIHNPGANNPARDFLEIWEFSGVDFANPAAAAFTLVNNLQINEFDSHLCGVTAGFCFVQPRGPDEIVLADDDPLSIFNTTVGVFDFDPALIAQNRRLSSFTANPAVDAEGLDVGDVNGGSAGEIVLADDNGASNTLVRVFNADGTHLQSFTTSPNFDPDGFAVGDVTGDRIAEIVLADDDPLSITDTEVGIFDRNGTLLSSFTVNPAVDADGFDVGDVNGDGTGEIILADDNAGGSTLVRIFDRTGAHLGSFTTAPNFDPDGFAVGDVTGDGVAEIVLADDDPLSLTDTEVGVFDQAGTLLNSFTTSPTVDAEGLDIGDVDADGIGDIVLADDNGAGNTLVRVFSRAGAHLGSFTTTPNFDPDGFAVGEMGDLDPLREVVMWRVQFRNFGPHQTLVGNFTTDVDATDRGGIRWFELRRQPAGPWTKFQEGTHSPDATNRWMGAIAMDGRGDIALGYNVSSPAVSPGIRYAGRLAGDPPGTLPRGEHELVAGAGSQYAVRWGDYSAMSVDPVDECTFWFTGEYMLGNGDWATQIGAFAFDECLTPEAPPVPGGMPLIEDINPDRSDLDPQDPDGASGGRVNGLASVPGTSQKYYAASEWGGLFRTSDAGRTWGRLEKHLPVTTWDVEVDPADSNTVYATSFYDGRLDSLSGIQVSHNGNQADPADVDWSHPATATPPGGFGCSAPRRSEPSAFGISITPGSIQDAYIGTNCGVAISRDQGATWTHVDPTPTRSSCDGVNLAGYACDVWDVFAEGTIRNFVGRSAPVAASYAKLDFRRDVAGEQQFRWRSGDSILGTVDTDGFIDASRWTFVAGNPNRVVFEGAKDGATFFGNAIFEPYSRAVVDVVRAGRRIRYELRLGPVDVCGDDGHLRSLDGGRTWTAGAPGLPAAARGRCSITTSPDEPHVLFVAGADNNVYESDNAGATWQLLGPAGGGRIPFVQVNQRSGTAFDLWTGGVTLYRAGCTTPAAPTPASGRRCPAGPGGAPGWAGPFTRFQGPLPSVGSQAAHDDVGDIVFDPTVSNDAVPKIFSSDGGVYRDTGGNASTPQWEQPDVTPHALWIYTLAGSHKPGPVAEDLYFGTQDNGSWGTITADAAIPAWHNQDCCDVFDIGPDSEADRVPLHQRSVLYTFFSPFRVFLGDRGLGAATNITAAFTANLGTANCSPAGGFPCFNFPDAVHRFGPHQYATATLGPGGGVRITSNVRVPVDGLDNDGNATIDDENVAWTHVSPASTPGTGFCSVQTATADGSADGLDNNLDGQIDEPREPDVTFFAQTTCVGGFETQSPGQLWRFRVTGGADVWTQIDQNAGAGGFGIFAVDPRDRDRLYASHLRSAAAGGPRMVSSNDGGATWNGDANLDMLMTAGGRIKYQTLRGPTSFAGSAKIGGATSGFQGYAQPSLVAFDPENGDYIVAGGRDSGVFLSLDRGRTWQLLTEPISPTPDKPHLPRPWFAYFDHDQAGLLKIYVGTQGRGAWRITVALPPPGPGLGPGPGPGPAPGPMVVLGEFHVAVGSQAPAAFVDSAAVDVLMSAWPAALETRPSVRGGELRVRGPRRIATPTGFESPLEPDDQHALATRVETTWTNELDSATPVVFREQWLVFPESTPYFLSMDRVHAANDSDGMFLRVDMPGHIKHARGDTFSEVYLSYGRRIPAREFLSDFAPDERYLYRRGVEPLPERFIRAYHLRDKESGTEGPWLAGMTLDPSVVSEAWCHQRGYVCLIEEFGGRPIKAGESFSAAFIVGYFSSLDEMHSVYDAHRDHTGLNVSHKEWKLTR